MMSLAAKRVLQMHASLVTRFKLCQFESGIPFCQSVRRGGILIVVNQRMRLTEKLSGAHSEVSMSNCVRFSQWSTSASWKHSHFTFNQSKLDSNHASFVCLFVAPIPLLFIFTDVCSFRFCWILHSSIILIMKFIFMFFCVLLVEISDSVSFGLLYIIQ